MPADTRPRAPKGFTFGTIIIGPAPARLPQSPEVAALNPCALCEHLNLLPRATNSVLGVRTAAAPVIARAQLQFEATNDGRSHVVVPVCPEHAAAVYTGHVAGVEMAWRMS